MSSSESTVMEPQAQTSAENANVILSYSNNFTPTSSNTSLRNARRNVMAHTRNSSFPASYFNSDPTTSHRYSSKSILRENSSGSNKSSRSKEQNNIKNDNPGIIEEFNVSSESFNSVANSSGEHSSRKKPARLQKSGSIDRR